MSMHTRLNLRQIRVFLIYHYCHPHYSKYQIYHHSIQTDTVRGANYSYLWSTICH